MIRLMETREITPFRWVHPTKERSVAVPIFASDPFRRLNHRNRFGNFGSLEGSNFGTGSFASRARLLFIENERSLKKHSRHLSRRSYISSYLAKACSLKPKRKVIGAENRRMSFGVPFERYDSGEPVSIDFASPAVGHDAITTPDFPVSDMGYAGSVAQRGLEPRRIGAVFEHGGAILTPGVRKDPDDRHD
jgi:hypothetical protein